ncbi:hypothetical protein GGF44_001511 [Coemansia sp. RSA 1694]|nr:hypothetical protein GGF44_001511 [Coemansia sp. RSA 1694]
MSPIYPSFEYLPRHVVQKVVDYVASSSRLQFDGVKPGSDDYKELPMELLWVCRNFREVVYARFSKTHKLVLSGQSSRVASTRDSWPSCFRDFANYSPPHLTKELVIELDPQTIFDGKAYKLLSRLPQAWFIFPASRLVALRFISYEFQDIEGTGLSEAESNISAFVRELRQLVPNASDIKIQAYGYLASISPNTLRFFGSLATQLCQGYSCMTFMEGAMGSAVKFQASGFRDLGHIDCVIHNDGARYLLFARHNAPTLKSLTFRLSPLVDISSLIQDANGRYVEYPCLHTLELRLQTTAPSKQPRVFAGAVPFPKLRRLCIDTHYPFGDDTPFRGNAATLEHLSIILCRDSANMLKQCSVFTPVSHPRLSFVKLGQVSELVPDAFETPAAYTQFMLSIAPRAPVREISCLETRVSALTSALSLHTDFAHIQILSLPSTYMLIWHAMALIKSLPLLTDLHSRAPNLGPLPAGVTQDELPAHTIAKYSLMGHRFRCWSFTSFSLDDSSDTVRCTLLLALVCPNFDYAATYHMNRRPFMLQMGKTIYSEQFKEHATRLQRLLFDR